MSIPAPDAAQTSTKANWWDAYPPVESSPPRISPGDLAALLRSKDGESVATIDVRRDDHGGGHVRGSDQWHAQTFHDRLPEFVDKYRGVAKVVFYCSRSNGRGPRCAGWYQDYLNKSGTTTSKAYVLDGGIIAWLEKYAGEEDLVDAD